MTASFQIGSRERITLKEFVELADSGLRVQSSHLVDSRLRKARLVVDSSLESGTSVYGMNTGLGALAVRKVSDDELAGREEAIIFGRACATGKPLLRRLCRTALLARLLSMAGGASGVHPDTFSGLLSFYNSGLIPVVPGIGSIGASDLVLNAHLSMPLIGHGTVWSGSAQMTALGALKSRGLEPLGLRPKDAMALINHGCISLSSCALAVRLAQRRIDEARLAAVMSFEGFGGNRNIFLSGVNSLRPAAGQARAARWFSEALADSTMPERRLQDPLSFRLVAPMFGAMESACSAAVAEVELELNGSSDSPAFVDGVSRIVSTPNFYNPALTNCIRLLSISIADCAHGSVQRLQKLMNPDLSDLPRYLSSSGGVASGMVPLQKTANALLSEIQSLAVSRTGALPAVSEAVEDIDNCLLGYSRNLEKQCDHFRRLSGIEAFVASQAIDLRGSDRCGRMTRALHDQVRAFAPRLQQDRAMHSDLEASASALSMFTEVFR